MATGSSLGSEFGQISFFNPNDLRFSIVGHCERQQETQTMGKQNQKEDEEKDNRREIAIASSLPLQSNFKPVGVTPQQLSKFQELHKRRLQIKAKSKIDKKPKGRAKKYGAVCMKYADSQESDSNTKVKDESVLKPKSHSEDDNPSTMQDNEAVQLSTKKRQKLHWGLDTKERWERKANM